MIECKVDDIMRSMKNLMNEAYSRDLSSKIGSAFDAKRANGEMLYRTVPYGYKKSGNPIVVTTGTPYYTFLDLKLYDEVKGYEKIQFNNMFAFVPDVALLLHYKTRY